MSIKNKHTEQRPQGQAWDFIIRNGLVQLQEVEAQAARLRVSLEYFEKRRASGDPFPGEEKLREAGLI